MQGELTNRTGETLLGPCKVKQGEGCFYKPEGERGQSQEGVRTGDSTEESKDNKTLPREDPVPESKLSKGGKCEGMTEQKTLSNYPVDREVHMKARRLQRKLWACAKQNRTRRFHAVYDRIYSWNILQEAYYRVRKNRGTSGVDGETIEDIETRGVEPFLREIQERLKEGRYHPRPVRRVWIPKAKGGKRALGIPTIRDRVVQMAANICLNPIFEADFKGNSYGFRPKRNQLQALERIRAMANKGYNYVVDVDIKDYFNTIDHELLLAIMRRRITDKRVLKLIKMWLKSGVMEEGEEQETEIGTPQGGVISPLLSNILLNELDREWKEKYSSYGKLTRFADDFVVQSLSERQAEAVKSIVQKILKQLLLEMHPQKSRIVNLAWGKEGFEYLGHHLQKTPSYRFRGKYFLSRWPTVRNMKKVKERIRGIVSRKRFGVKDVRELVPEINRALRGWRDYFKWGNASKAFNQIDRYVYYRLALFENKRRGRKRPHRFREFTYEWFRTLGVEQLMGTVQFIKPSLVLVKANA